MFALRLLKPFRMQSFKVPGYKESSNRSKLDSNLVGCRMDICYFTILDTGSCRNFVKSSLNKYMLTHTYNHYHSAVS